MNLLLLEDADLLAGERAEVRGLRCTHVRKILKLGVGDQLRVGRVDGPLGSGTIAAIDRERVELELSWDVDAPLPAASALTLAVALPRPPTLSKVLQQGTAMGVKRFWFFHSRRVEKSYWDAKALEPEALRADLRLGLEQARDTRMPKIDFFRRFRPFAEDTLGKDEQLGEVLVADPPGAQVCPHAVDGARVVVLGPEGGFVDFERELLADLGHRLVSLGPRILRVETAAVALLGRLSP